MSKCPEQALFREDGKNTEDQVKPCEHKRDFAVYIHQLSNNQSKTHVQLKINGSRFIFHILSEKHKSHMQRLEFIIIIGEGVKN